ncbi:MAG: hypothetical protein PHH28_14595 [Desulfuromonadaceae bacterium]|nr:hypothetical protein [Desulfuromonadaceae bacterium]
MRKIILAGAALVLIASSVVAAERPMAPNGIACFPDYLSWKVIAPSYREDKGQIRIILCQGMFRLPHTGSKQRLSFYQNSQSSMIFSV